MDNRTRIRITNTVVAVTEPGAKEFVLWDNAIAGFGLRVRPSGGKSFIFTYRTAGGRDGKVQRVTIGNATKLKADPARERAKELAGQHHGGIDPAKERADEREAIEAENNAPTVADLLDRFVTDHVRTELKPSTGKEYERLIEKVLKPKLGHHKAANLSPKEVSAAYHELKGTPTQGAHSIRVLSSAMKLAEVWGYRSPGTNPCKIRLKGSRRRERLFSNGEVARLLAMVSEHETANKMTAPCALALRLLFATGCRAGEICDLRWQDVDLVEGEISWPDSKTGSLKKAITTEAAKLFKAAERFEDCDYVCPSPALKRLRVETLEGAFERVMKAAKVPANENATLHLIRHWFATRTYSDASIPLNLQMRIVGHKSVATAMRYAHAAKEDLKAATLQAEKKRTAAIRAAEKAGKVIAMPVSGGR